jgi:bla regulator protein blaR1
MADSLSTAGFAILSWGATYLIHSSLLVGGVGLFLRVRRGASHRLSETLWKLALVGGVATASLQMLTTGGTFQRFTITLDQPGTTLGEVPRSDQSTAQVTLSADEHAVATAENLVSPITLDLDTAALDAALPDSEHRIPEAARLPDVPGTNRIVENAGSARSPAQAFATIGISILLAALVLGLARCLWQTLVLARKLSGSRELHSGPAWQILEELRCTLPGTPGVRLLQVSDDLEPAAFGIGRWTIVIPERAVHALSREELRALLAHELAHLIRGDSIWLGVSRAICSCLAFQPLNHLARREWQRAAEFLCDKWAVDRTGTPLALARCLAEVAGWRLAACRSNATLAATGRKTGLVDRIELLLDARPALETDGSPRAPLLVFAGLALLVFVWCAPAVQFAVAAAIRDVAPAANPALETPPAAPSSAPADVAAVTAPAGTPVDQPADLRLLLTVLDEDIAGLERELLELQPLLARAESPPAARDLAARLKTEVVRLQERRAILNSLLHQPVSDQP